MTLAKKSASVWFIKRSPLSNGKKKLIDFNKYWDANAIAKHLHELLSQNFKREIGICYNKVFSFNVTIDIDKKDINNFYNLANHCMEFKAPKITKIMIIFGIQ